jgi:hypothetical protein
MIWFEKSPILTSGTGKGKISGRSCKANRIFAANKISYPQDVENKKGRNIKFTSTTRWKTLKKYPMDNQRLLSGNLVTIMRQPPGGTLSSVTPQGFILSISILITPT